MSPVDTSIFALSPEAKAKNKPSPLAPQVSLLAFEESRGMDRKSIMEARGYVYDETTGKWA